MKKTLVALSLLALASAASAQEINKHLSDGYSVFGGVSLGNTAGEKSTGYTLGVDYTKYLNNGFFVQPSLQYIDSKTDYNDKHIVGLVNGGYTFLLDNNVTVSPKAGVGYRYTKWNRTYTQGELGVPIPNWTVHESGSDSGVVFNVGVDVGFAKNWNVGLNHMRMKGKNGNHADYTSLTLGYKF